MKKNSKIKEARVGTFDFPSRKKVAAFIAENGYRSKTDGSEITWIVADPFLTFTWSVNGENFAIVCKDDNNSKVESWSGLVTEMSEDLADTKKFISEYKASMSGKPEVAPKEESRAKKTSKKGLTEKKSIKESYDPSDCRDAVRKSVVRAIDSCLVEEIDEDDEMTNSNNFLAAIVGAYEALSQYVPDVNEFFNVDQINWIKDDVLED